VPVKIWSESESEYQKCFQQLFSEIC